MCALARIDVWQDDFKDEFAVKKWINKIQKRQSGHNSDNEYLFYKDWRK